MKEKIKAAIKNKYVSLSLAGALMLGAGFGIAKATDGHHRDYRAMGPGKGMGHNARFDRGDERGGGHGKGMWGGNSEERINKRIERMKTSLQLSDAQAQQIKQILSDDAKQMQAQFEARKGQMKADTSKGRPRFSEAQREQMKAQMKAHHDALDQKIVAVLNAQQKEQYQKQMQERQQKGARKHEGRRGQNGVKS